ncbi:hypothetical protein [Streptomyces niveus]|uniref:hypothetical protein n=1 Tax=Streptomyces niveus TaxID=193462 RepID=UPI00343252B4
MKSDTAHPTAPHPAPVQHTAPTGHFTIRLSATPRRACLARHRAADQLHNCDQPYDIESNHTASLLVAELATNAALHGRYEAVNSA